MTIEEFHARVKAMRVEVDGSIKDCNQLVKAITSARDLDMFGVLLGRGGIREVGFVVQHLEEAKMWLGKVLGATGHTLPEAYRDEAPDGNH